MISEKAMVGQNGFLFLNSKDTNNLVEHLRGNIAITKAAHHIHRENKKAIDKLELPFLGMIVPEAHCVYPEYLPHDIKVSEERPVISILPGISGQYDYLLKILSDYKAAQGVIYTGKDSHWTQFAALESYTTLRHRIQRHHPLQIAYKPSLDAEIADLTIKDPRQALAAEKTMSGAEKIQCLPLFDSQMVNHGNVKVIHNHYGSGRCLAFGTSFSRRLIPAYISDFRETIFCYGTTIDPFMVKLVRPDCVISEFPERFVHFPNLAVPGSTFISMLIGITDPDAASNPLIAARSDVPEESRDLYDVLSEMMAFATQVDSTALVRRLEGLEEHIARKMALLKPLLGQPAAVSSLRQLLAGFFYNSYVMSSASAMIDSGFLNVGNMDLMPDSVPGYLSKVRILLRAGLDQEAMKALEMGISNFGTHTESNYYRNYLKR